MFFCSIMMYKNIIFGSYIWPVFCVLMNFTWVLRDHWDCTLSLYCKGCHTALVGLFLVFGIRSFLLLMFRSWMNLMQIMHRFYCLFGLFSCALLNFTWAWRYDRYFISALFMKVLPLCSRFLGCSMGDRYWLECSVHGLV